MDNRRLTLLGHLPLNHGLRAFYRGLMAIAAVALVLSGVLWIVANGSVGGDGASLLGLRANGAFGLVALVLGAVLLAAVLIGRNAAHWAGYAVAALCMVLGILFLALIRTTPEPFHLGAGTCMALLVEGVVVLNCASYVGTGSSEQASHRRFTAGQMTAEEYRALGREH